MTELSCISSGWTRAGFVGSNQTATPSLSLSFTLTHVVLQLLLFHTLSLSPSLPLLLPPSTTSSAVAPPLVPTFPPKPQEWHQGHKPSPARPTPPPACPRLPHGAPCTLGARVLQRARNSTVCVCLRACVLACRLDSSTIVHRTAHPEVAPRCRTGRRESCIPVTGCLLAPHCPPPTPGGGHLGAPNFLGSFFLESMEMAAQRSDSPQAQVETNGGRFSCPNWSQLETPTLTGKTRNEECLIQFKPSSKRHSF